VLQFFIFIFELMCRLMPFSQ